MSAPPISLESAWVGPHGHWPTQASVGADPLLSVALTTMQAALDPAGRTVTPSPTVAGVWTGGTPKGGQLSNTKADPGHDALFRYNPELRVQLIGQEVLSSLSFFTGAAQAVCRSGGQVVYSLDKPTPNMLTSEVAAVKDASTRRLLQLAEILAQATAPGVFIHRSAGIALDSHPHTREALHIVAAVVTAAVHPVKHKFRIARPTTLDATLAPSIDTPLHASFPSGHAAFAYAFAEFLPALIGGSRTASTRTTLLRVADLVADNRVVAGVHFPMDSAAGEVMGRSLGAWLAALAEENQSIASFEELAFTVNGTSNTAVREMKGSKGAPTSSPAWQWLAHQARAEWT